MHVNITVHVEFYDRYKDQAYSKLLSNDFTYFFQ